MTHVTFRLTAKNQDQLRNSTLVIEYGLPLPLPKPGSRRCLTKALLHLRIHLLNTTLQLFEIVLKLGKPVSHVPTPLLLTCCEFIVDLLHN